MRAYTVPAVAVLLVGTLAAGAEPAPQKAELAFSVVGKPDAAPNARSVKCTAAFGPVAPIAALAFSPDGKSLAVAGYGEVVLWDLEKGQLAKRLGSGKLGDVVGAVAFLPDGKSLAVGGGTPCGDGAVNILSVESGEVTASFDEPKEVVYCLELSPDGKLLAAGGADGTAHVWSLAEKKPVKTIDVHNGWVQDVTFSPDGTMLITAGADRTAIVWKIEDWSRVQTLDETEAIQGAAFASDNKQLVLAVGGPSGWALNVRRTDNVRSRRAIYYRGGMPLDVVWLADGNKIVAPLADGNVLVFANLRLTTTLAGHTDWVYAVAVSPDGKKVASGSADGTVKLWSLADGKLLATLVQLTPQTDEWLAMTPQGFLATSSAGALKWEAANVKTPPEQLPAVFTKPESVAHVLSGEEVAPPKVE